MSTTYIDGPSVEIAEGLSGSVLQSAYRFSDRELQSVVDGVSLGSSDTIQYATEGQDACDTLAECIRVATSELRKWSNAYTSLRWLWMLRRVPYDVFRGNLITTIGYDRTLAEVISGASEADQDEARVSEGGAIHFQLDAAVIRRLARFCEGVRFLSDLHRCYRWAGKGATLIFKRGHRPIHIVSDETRTAVRKYDRRAAASARPLSRAGSVLTSDHSAADFQTILWVHSIAPTKLPTLLPGIRIQDASPANIIQSECQFLPEPLPIDGLAALIEDRRIGAAQLLSKDAAVLTLLLTALPVLAMRHYSGFLSLMQRGYLMWGNKDVALAHMEGLFSQQSEFLQSLLAVAGVQNTDDMLAATRGMDGSSWPLVAGPICRECERGMCVDFAAATSRLEALLEFPRVDGEVANARAQHFEQEAQAIVDRSDWSPSKPLRELRARQLFLNGNAVSDIDVIGALGDVLLFVDCKSVIYSGSYDIGDYRSVRNVASLARDALKRWQQVCEVLETNPVGDNYDFTNYSSILGVICVPQMIFADLATLEAEASPGLFSICTIVELAEWLDVAIRFPKHRRPKRA